MTTYNLGSVSQGGLALLHKAIPAVQFTARPAENVPCPPSHAATRCLTFNRLFDFWSRVLLRLVPIEMPRKSDRA